MTAAQDTPNATLTRSERRRARTRQAMLDVGQAVIAERGLDRLTIASITEAGDVALGSFYNHFADRDDYLRALALEALDSWIDDVRRLRVRPFDNGLERITVAIYTLFDRCRTDSDLRLFLSEIFARTEQPGTIEFGALFHDNLVDARERGDAAFENVDLTAQLVVGAVRQCLVHIGTPEGATTELRLMVCAILRLVGANEAASATVLDLAEQNSPYTPADI